MPFPSFPDTLLEEANQLIRELPLHLQDMVSFSLSTGLRASNVTGLLWENVDLSKRHAWIHPDQAKANKAIPVPLNESVLLGETMTEAINFIQINLILIRLWILIRQYYT
jgi:integrase